ncbi:MAG: ABC transporter substrate-binding protein [Spirochaetota bacterium]
MILHVRFIHHLSTAALLVVFVLAAPPAVYPQEQRDTRIIIFTPTTADNTYWPQVYAVLNAAAEDLGVELLGYEFDVEDRFAKHTEGLEILRSTREIDGAIFSVAFGQTEPLLRATDRRGIPVFIQGPLFESELRRVGGAPREVFGSWVGYFYQDEKEKGYELGRILLSGALEAGLFDSRGNVHVAGIGGDPTWFGSELRAAGLVQAVEEEPRGLLTQVVPTQWTQAEGRRVAAGLLARYPELSVIWAASDQLAIGAADAAREAGRDPNGDLLLGGLDLSPPGLRAVEDGVLTATVASSLLSYAEVLVYLYDYIQGYDFASEVGAEIRLGVHLTTEATAARHLLLYRSLNAIDFALFSRALNPEHPGYDFSLAAYERALDTR